MHIVKCEKRDLMLASVRKYVKRSLIFLKTYVNCFLGGDKILYIYTHT